MDEAGSFKDGIWRLAELHRALKEGDAHVVAVELEGILLGCASCYDLVSENSYHMLVAGLLFGMRGYGNPMCNRGCGRGRFDVQLVPDDPKRDPLITLELKFAKGGNGKASLPDELASLAKAALEQIASRVYAASPGEAGSLRWGLAFSGKLVAAASKRVALSGA